MLAPSRPLHSRRTTPMQRAPSRRAASGEPLPRLDGRAAPVVTSPTSAVRRLAPVALLELLARDDGAQVLDPVEAEHPVQVVELVLEQLADVVRLAGARLV